MKISYDQAADVLYLIFEHTKRRCDYVEEGGVVLRVRSDTKAVVGCTIPRFSVQAKSGLEMSFLECAPIANVPALAGREQTLTA